MSHSQVYHKQFVLLSGGLDSAVVLYHAINNFPSGSAKIDVRGQVEAISIDYGQRHSKEMWHAAKICADAKVPHRILQMPNLLAGVMLTDGYQEIPQVSYDQLPHGISPTYVPFRNGLMISMLAAHAQKWVMGTQQQFDNARATIYIGAHSEDAANDAYPDCSPRFLDAMKDAVRIGTYDKVHLEAPLSGAQKSDVVTLGAKYSVPFADTWSCYRGEDLHCGTCPTCRARKEAFLKAGIEDPTQYATA